MAFWCKKRGIAFTVCWCRFSLRAARRRSLGWKIWKSTCAATRGRNPICVSTRGVTRPSATPVTEPNTSEHTWRRWVNTITQSCLRPACLHLFVFSPAKVFLPLCLHRSRTRARCPAVQNDTLIPAPYGSTWNPTQLKNSSNGRRYTARPLL